MGNFIFNKSMNIWPEFTTLSLDRKISVLVGITVLLGAGYTAYRFFYPLDLLAAPPISTEPPTNGKSWIGDANHSTVTQIWEDDHSQNASSSHNQDSTFLQIQGDNNNIHFPVEQFERMLQTRESRLRVDLARAHDAERALIEQQLWFVQRQLTDVNNSYRKTLQENQRLKQELQILGVNVPQEQLEAALQALSRGDRSQAERLLQHVEEAEQPHLVRSARAAYERGKIAYDEIRWSDARQHFLRAARYRNFQDNEMVYWAARLNELMGDYAAAKPLYLQTQKLAMTTQGAQSVEIAAAYNNLAELNRAQGRYPEAESLYLQAIEISEKVLPPEHPTLATQYNNLAALYDSQGRYAEAEPLYLKALAINKKVLPSDHPTLATQYNNLALLYDSQGRYTEAESLYLQAIAIEIDKKALPSEHPNLARDYNNLAAFYSSQQRYTEAEPFYRQALKIAEQALGADHPTTRRISENYATFRAQSAR